MCLEEEKSESKHTSRFLTDLVGEGDYPRCQLGNIQPFSLFLGAKKYKLSFIWIKFKFATRHPFLNILKASVQLIKSR